MDKISARITGFPIVSYNRDFFFGFKMNSILLKFVFIDYLTEIAFNVGRLSNKSFFMLLLRTCIEKPVNP